MSERGMRKIEHTLYLRNACRLILSTKNTDNMFEEARAKTARN